MIYFRDVRLSLIIFLGLISGSALGNEAPANISTAASCPCKYSLEEAKKANQSLTIGSIVCYREARVINNNGKLVGRGQGYALQYNPAGSQEKIAESSSQYIVVNRESGPTTNEFGNSINYIVSSYDKNNKPMFMCSTKFGESNEVEFESQEEYNQCVTDLKEIVKQLGVICVL